MADIRDRIELWFDNFGRVIFKRAWLFLFLSLLATGAMVSQLPSIRMDTSAEGLLHKEDPALKTYQDFRRQFGRDETVIIGLSPANIFDLDFLAKLKDFQAALENEVPNISEVSSLANAAYIDGQGDDLIVEDLLEDLPANEGELALFKQKVMAHPLYPGTIISEDGMFTIIVLTPVIFSTSKTAGAGTDSGRLLSEDDFGALFDAVQMVAGRFNTPDFPVIVGGEVATEVVLKRLALDTMSRFMLLTGLLIIIITAIMFRRISGVIYPFLVVNCALLATLGLMAFFKTAMTLNTTILPSFILAVGIGDSIHILTIFYRHFNQHHDKEEAISYALGHSGLAVVMTSLTTAGGLLSFVSAGIAPIAELGIFAAVGVMLALAYTLVTLPALLAAIPLSKKKMVESAGAFSRLDNFLVRVGDFAADHPWPVVAVSGLILLVSFALASQLGFSHNSLKYLPRDMETRQATEMIDQHMKGSLNVEVLIDTGRENGLYDPAVLHNMEKAQRLGEKLRVEDAPVGKSISVVDTIKEMNQALNGGNPDYFKIPEERQLIAQELLLYEIGGGDDLRTLVDSGYQKARITLNLPWVDAIEYDRVLTNYQEQLKDIFGATATATVTGMAAVICRTFSVIISTMANSYLIAAVIITGLMVLLIGNLKVGLVSMIPNFLPIVMGLGFMKIVGLPLDYSNIMVGGVAIGLAVDDTVHFMHNFRRYFARTGDARQAVHLTLTSAGRAMLFTTLILCAGFLVLLFAQLQSTVNFGLITGFTISMALLADFLLAPALMVLISRQKS
ncbi:MAG: MMPL family transporter [Proteobacteria bacterium]|nr:MMPL family transporter [Pseudomonadota bacterium]MBU1715572.1 MMPL family transporter [Pseudomonadota bacterium]